MAELILRLRVDPVTGRREIVVDYASDADALPIEHEEEHRRLAAAVVAGGLGAPGLEVTRAPEPVAETTSPDASPSPPERAPQKSR